MADPELSELSDDFIEDYAPLTKAMQFHVSKSAFGKGLFATEDRKLSLRVRPTGRCVDAAGEHGHFSE